MHNVILEANGGDKAEEKEDSVSSESSDVSEDDEVLEPYFSVLANPQPPCLTEQDLVRSRCETLALQHLRQRPTLPAAWEDPAVSWTDTDSGWRIPVFSCPFKGCDFGTDSRVDFLLHMAGAKSPHRTTIEEVCLPDTTPWLQRIDYIYGAIAYHEQRQWPRLGLAVTRRVLRAVTHIWP